jgi:hypothetical protein
MVVTTVNQFTQKNLYYLKRAGYMTNGNATPVTLPQIPFNLSQLAILLKVRRELILIDKIKLKTYGNG